MNYSSHYINPTCTALQFDVLPTELAGRQKLSKQEFIKEMLEEQLNHLMKRIKRDECLMILTLIFLLQKNFLKKFTCLSIETTNKPQQNLAYVNSSQNSVQICTASPVNSRIRAYYAFFAIVRVCSSTLELRNPWWNTITHSVDLDAQN